MNCSTTVPNLLSGGTRGWVGQSDDRGTLDIVVSSSITIFLCIWTTVCVNVPSPEHGVWAIFRDRWHMFCLGLLGPEFTVLLAIGQYCSARASVRQFKAKYNNWTVKHGFFADMGGVHLQVENLKSFPITSKQLYFLAEHDFISYPHITTTMINDKNKSDGLARLIASLQILWFTLSTISRPIKGYATTTLEITTLAYIFCAWASMFFWRCKPMDVQDPIMVQCKVPLAAIVDRHGRSAAEHFHLTPLDFIDRQEWIGSKLWTYYVSLLRKMKIIYVYEKELPARHFSSFNFMAPDKPFVILILMIACTYSAIFLAAWNLHFPTDLERLLWRNINYMKYRCQFEAILLWWSQKQNGNCSYKMHGTRQRTKTPTSTFTFGPFW
ncbi:hypothetical protein CFE70_006190 [Pyrenophora teres f. teres 0-1]